MDIPETLAFRHQTVSYRTGQPTQTLEHRSGPRESNWKKNIGAPTWARRRLQTVTTRGCRCSMPNQYLNTKEEEDLNLSQIWLFFVCVWHRCFICAVWNDQVFFSLQLLSVCFIYLLFLSSIIFLWRKIPDTWTHGQKMKVNYVAATAEVLKVNFCFHKKKLLERCSGRHCLCLFFGV